MRRLAAILPADVVGYGRLMEQDEAGTLAALKARRAGILAPLVAAHRGRIVKVMGDGVLVEFASAVNAVACAVELQKKMAAANDGVVEDRRIVLRIGINLGDVVVEGGDLYGEGVIVAVRLQAMAEAGGICVSGSVQEQVGNKLPLAFEDLGSSEVKNIAKPVRAFRVLIDDRHPETPVASRRPQARPSIAVLPFTNLSGDLDQRYFTDGVTEDIITELSRFHTLFVIARNSSFQYRDKAVDVRQVARDLSVQYIVEGSVRKTNSRLRVTAQLIDATSGAHLWAERYDRSPDDVFAVQDEVVQAIVSMLAVRLEDEGLKLARRKPPQDMRAYDLWLRGKQCLDLWTAESNAQARSFFKQAIEIDPNFARAYAGLAASYEWAAFYSKWAPPGEDARESALQHARRAVALDDGDHEPHVVLAWVYHERRQFDQSRRHLERAHALNPNDADALANRSMMLTLQGDPEAGTACIEAAIRLNPRRPDSYVGFLAASRFFARNYGESIRLRESLSAAYPEGDAVLAAAYALTGSSERALETMAAFLSRYSLYWQGPPSARRMIELMALKRQEDEDLLMEGLLRAGMPE